MSDERICGTAACLLNVAREDIVHLREEIKTVKDIQLKILEILANQSSIVSQLDILKEEFNRNRDSQAVVNKDFHDQFKNVVTVSYLKWSLSLVSVIIVVLNYIGNHLGGK